MGSKNNIEKIIAIFEIIVLVFSIFIPSSNAESNNVLYVTNSFTRNDTVITQDDLHRKEFFIKNMYTGHYLDVQNGTVASGTNVWQYTYNGTDSQRWFLYYDPNDDTYVIYSRLTDDGTYKFALDISGGSTNNYANVQIYNYNGTASQKFKIERGSYGTFYIKTKVTNFEKAVVVNGPRVEVGNNIDQYTFQNHINEWWILEPVDKTPKMGIAYAEKTYDKFVMAYPNCSGIGGDCTNFVSQCLQNAGYHYQNNWYVVRKGTQISEVQSISELNSNWSLADPSPWISAPQFKDYWKSRVSTYEQKGTDIRNNPSIAWNLNIEKGDVIQIANAGLFRSVGEAWHTMYITGYTDTPSSTYTMTYHSNSEKNKSLITILNMNGYDKYYYIFYDMT